jgi:Flp pilus assembly protein TadD
VSDVRRRYGEALDNFGSGKLHEAVSLMEDILREDPGFLDAYEGLAMTVARLGNLDRAIGLMEELARRDPASIMAHSNLSVFYLKKGLKEKAEEEKAKATVLQFAARAKPKQP